MVKFAYINHLKPRLMFIRSYIAFFTLETFDTLIGTIKKMKRVKI